MTSGPISSAQTRFPTLKQEDPFDKGLDGIFDILLSPRTKKKAPISSETTNEKCRITIIEQMITKGSAADSIACLQLVGEIIYTFAKEIQARLTKDPRVLDRFLENNKSDQGKQLITVSAPTLSRALDDYPEQDASCILSSQVEIISRRLTKQGLMPTNQVLVVDPSDILYRGKYPNQWTPFAYTGQKTQYKRAFKENIIYLDPLQLICGCAPSPIKGKKRCNQDLPLWINQIKFQLQIANANHSPIDVILGDREFYSGIGNALSYLGLWDPSRLPENNPRLIVPKKIWNNASEKKWAFLLDPNAQILEKDEIELDYYDQPYLGKDLLRLPKNRTGTRYFVPVASLAVFDNYPNGHKPQTMDWAHIEAKKIETQIQNTHKKLKRAELTFIQYVSKIVGRKATAPTYGKKPRTKFKDPKEKQYYTLCLVLNKSLHRWEEKKEKLLKRLMFFTISLHENETIAGREGEFTALAQLYHQRWGVEIGVKLVKWEFPITTNNRKPTRRHLNWVISALVENSWHYYRLTRAARKIKVICPNWKPFNTENPRKRKKWYHEISPVLSARGYLIELLEVALKRRIKSAICESGKI